MLTDGNLEDWGFIPSFLDFDDPRPVREQFDEHYMGGWNKFDGFTWDSASGTLTYPGDPPMKFLSGIWFRDERILLFPHAWVMVVQPDGSWEVARMD